MLSQNDTKEFWDYLIMGLTETLVVRAIRPNNQSCAEESFIDTFQQFLDFCTAHNGKNHVFIGINPRGENDSVSRLCRFVIDLDNPTGDDLETAKKLKPSIIVSSGNGYHIYFCLDGRPCVDRDLDTKRNSEAVKKLQKLFTGKVDPACVDVERVMRVPGTTNLKNGKMAEIIYRGLDDGRFKKWFVSIRVDETKRPKISSYQGITERLTSLRLTDRALDVLWKKTEFGDTYTHSERDFSIACKLKQHGWGEADIKEALRLKRLEEGDEKGKAEREDYLERTVDSAYRQLSVQNQSVYTKNQSPYQIAFSSTEIFKDIKKTEWLVNDLLPKSSITFVVGDSKTGKSYFALETALSVSLGRLVAGRFNSVMERVLFLELEDGIQIMAPRYHALVNAYGQQPTSDQFRIYMGHEMKLDTESSYNQLLDQCKEFKPGLIVVDTLAKCHSKDEISAKEMTLVLDKLQRLRNDFRCAILIVHHFNKGQYERKHFNRRTLRGSTVIEASAEVIIRAQRNDLGDAVDCYVTSKVSPDTGFSYRLVEWSKDGKDYARLEA